MGHVGGELTAVALGKGLLRDVEGQQHRAGALAVDDDGGDVELVLVAVPRQAGLAVALGGRVTEGAADGRLTLHGQEVLADAAVVRLKNTAGSGVQAQHHAALIQQHQPLIHVGGDLLELLRLAAEVAELVVDLTALVLQPAQQRRQLLVGVVIQRMLQIQPVQGLDDAAGHAAGQQARQDQRHHQHQQQRLEHGQQQHAPGDPGGGQAQHRAVGQAPGVIQRFLQQRGAVAAALAHAGGQRLLHLLTLGMVLHGGRVGPGVVQHRAVGLHPGDAVVVGGQLAQVCFALALHRRGGDGQLVTELALLQADVVVVQAAQDHRQRGHQHRQPHRQGGVKNSFCHIVSSQR